jgi:hypothetical protein
MKKTALIFTAAFIVNAAQALWAQDYLPLKDEWKEDTWGYQDEKGNVLIAPKFSEVYPFSEGIGLVRTGSYDWYYINTKGDVISKNAVVYRNDDKPNAFSEGFGIVQREVTIEKKDSKGRTYKDRIGDKKFYIDKTGKELSTGYDEAYPFNGGLAVVKQNNKYFAIDNKFKQLFEIPGTDRALNFSSGLLAIKNANGKWGFVDKTGKVVISAKYDDKFEFYNGYAVWFDGDNEDYYEQGGYGKLIVINMKGEEEVIETYKDIKPYIQYFTVLYFENCLLVFSYNTSGYEDSNAANFKILNYNLNTKENKNIREFRLGIFTMNDIKIKKEGMNLFSVLRNSHWLKNIKWLFDTQGNVVYDFSDIEKEYTVWYDKYLTLKDGTYIDLVQKGKEQRIAAEKKAEAERAAKSKAEAEQKAKEEADKKAKQERTDGTITSLVNRLEDNFEVDKKGILTKKSFEAFIELYKEQRIEAQALIQRYYDIAEYIRSEWRKIETIVEKYKNAISAKQKKDFQAVEAMSR